MTVGKHHNTPDSSFDSDELEAGIHIEMEHTDDPDIAKEIAKDHLAEIEDYYTRLVEMEAKAGLDMNKAQRMLNGASIGCGSGGRFGCDVFESCRGGTGGLGGERIERMKAGVRAYAHTVPSRLRRILKNKTKRELQSLVVAFSMMIDPSKISDPRVWKTLVQEPEIVSVLRELKP